MDAFELGGGRVARLERRDPAVGHRGVGDPGRNRLESSRSFRMAPAGVVVEEQRVAGDEQHRAGEYR